MVSSATVSTNQLITNHENIVYVFFVGIQASSFELLLNIYNKTSQIFIFRLNNVVS